MKTNIFQLKQLCCVGAGLFVSALGSSFAMADLLHRLRVGDEVVAKYPPFRGRADNPWFSGTVTALNVTVSPPTCTVRFCDGDRASGILSHEVLYCPNGRHEY